MKIGVVLNPAAGAGKAAQLWPALEGEIRRQLGDFALMKTEQPQDAARFAGAFAQERRDLVIACGGDGTIGETVDGLLKSGLAAEALPRFAVLPCGTGSDFARSIGMAGTLREMTARIAAGAVREIERRARHLCRRRGPGGGAPFHQHFKPRPVWPHIARRQQG